MPELKRTLKLLDRTFHAKSWHGPALLQSLKGVTAAQAARRGIPGAHSIWELVLHCAYWKDQARAGLDGTRPRVRASLNFPAITDTSEEAWQAAVRRLKDSHSALAERVSRLRPADLEGGDSGQGSRAYVLVQGVMDHDLYHAGQIMLLKKLN